jgi:hypothetical protein
VLERFRTVVLRDDQVTPEAIRDVFDLYLIKQIRANQGRARFLFAYDGHGASPSDPTLKGGLALSSIIGAQDSNPDHSFPLDELALKLKTIATFSLQSLALLGSWYSGGVLFPYRSSNYDTTYSLRPGAHVVAAARKDELAISYPDGCATFFFDSIIRAVRQSKQPEYTSASTRRPTPWFATMRSSGASGKYLKFDLDPKSMAAIEKMDRIVFGGRGQQGRSLQKQQSVDALAVHRQGAIPGHQEAGRPQRVLRQ